MTAPVLQDFVALVLKRKPQMTQFDANTAADKAMYIFNHPKYTGKAWMTPELAVKLALFGGHEE